MQREQLINELRRLEKYGFYVIPEAIILAEHIDMAPLSALPLSAAALALSQRALEETYGHPTSTNYSQKDKFHGAPLVSLPETKNPDTAGI